MNQRSRTILEFLASDVDALADVGRYARDIAFKLREKKRIVVHNLGDLVRQGMVSTWRFAAAEPARYRVTEAGRALFLPIPADTPESFWLSDEEIDAKNADFIELWGSLGLAPLPSVEDDDQDTVAYVEAPALGSLVLRAARSFFGPETADPNRLGLGQGRFKRNLDIDRTAVLFAWLPYKPSPQEVG